MPVMQSYLQGDQTRVGLKAVKWLGAVVNQQICGEAEIMDMIRNLWHSLQEKRPGKNIDGK